MAYDPLSTVRVSIPGKGTFTASALSVDVMISRYLPASPQALRKVLADKTGESVEDWSMADSISAMLIVLASLWESGMTAAS